MKTLGRTELKVSPLALGGNTFGWTADRDESFAVLDAYRGAGGNFIDTADQYSSWVPGNQGGESETIIGEWLSRRTDRDEIILATKCGRTPGFEGLAPANIRTCLDGSLHRLGVDHVDVYFAHIDDSTVPLEDTLGTFDELVSAGKIRHVAASNFTASRLAESLRAARAHGWAEYVAVETHYNLVERCGYEADLRDVVVEHGLSCLPYYALASGFLTGKYRPGRRGDGPRARNAEKYCTNSGFRVLDALDTVATNHGVSVAAVALAWLASHNDVAAPLASARTVDQLVELMRFVDVQLEPAERALLDDASGRPPREPV